MTALAVISKAERRHYWSHQTMNGLAAAINASDVTQNHIVATSKKSIMRISGSKPAEAKAPRPAEARREKTQKSGAPTAASEPAEWRNPAGNTPRLRERVGRPRHAIANDALRARFLRGGNFNERA